jgi:hypothetical protein
MHAFDVSHCSAQVILLHCNNYATDDGDGKSQLDDVHACTFLHPALQVGGLLLAAPEHRLSLQHKWRELWEDPANAAVCDELQVLLKGLPYVDLLDESDELLNHR